MSKLVIITVSILLHFNVRVGIIHIYDFVAAQFFWEKGSTNKIIKDETQNYKIAVGKYKRDYLVVDNEYTQIIDVSI